MENLTPEPEDIWTKEAEAMQRLLAKVGELVFDHYDEEEL